MVFTIGFTILKSQMLTFCSGWFGCLVFGHSTHQERDALTLDLDDPPKPFEKMGTSRHQKEEECRSNRRFEGLFRDVDSFPAVTPRVLLGSSFCLRIGNVQTKAVRP